MNKLFKETLVLLWWNVLGYLALCTLVGSAQTWTAIYGKL